MTLVYLDCSIHRSTLENNIFTSSFVTAVLDELLEVGLYPKDTCCSLITLLPNCPASGNEKLNEASSTTSSTITCSSLSRAFIRDWTRAARFALYRNLSINSCICAILATWASRCRRWRSSNYIVHMVYIVCRISISSLRIYLYYALHYNTIQYNTYKYYSFSDFVRYINLASYSSAYLSSGLLVVVEVAPVVLQLLVLEQDDVRAHLTCICVYGEVYTSMHVQV